MEEWLRKKEQTDDQSDGLLKLSNQTIYFCLAQLLLPLFNYTNINLSYNTTYKYRRPFINKIWSVKRGTGDYYYCIIASEGFCSILLKIVWKTRVTKEKKKSTQARLDEHL